MITEVILPKLGQTMEEGTIVEWFKKEGDAVRRGDSLFSIESDKATLEVEATGRGFLRKILVPAGETRPVMTVVALMTRTADEPLEGLEVQGLEKKASASEPATGRIFASPRARKTAAGQGVDLAQVTGSGPGGRIVERDVLAFLRSQPPQPAEDRIKATPVALKAADAIGLEIATVTGTGVSGRIMQADVEAAAAATERPAVESLPLSGVRRVIAERMAASARETARVTLISEVDATEMVRAREQIRAAVAGQWGFAPGYNDLLGVIVARALSEHPYMNARLSQDGAAIERLPAVNLGLAVDTERGLLVPVIRDADRKGLRVFGTEFRALVERARQGKSLPDDLSGGTFTLTNLGMYEVDAFTPVINLPEAAILGVGRIKKQLVVTGDLSGLAVRQMLTLSLVFDHRLVDGTPAARFLQRIKQLVENPFLLL